jgi:Mn-dependent DtxR family transcriptional regulator
MNFVKVPHSELRRTDLGSNSKLLLFYLRSHTDTFKFKNKDIIKAIGISENTFYKCVNELIELGIIEKSKVCYYSHSKNEIKNLIDYNLTAYNNEQIASCANGFVTFYNRIFGLDINATEKILLGYIIGQSNNKDWNLTNSGIAKIFGISKRYVITCLDKLQEKKLIKQYGNGFDVLLDNLKSENEVTAKTSKDLKCEHYSNLMKNALIGLGENVESFKPDMSYSGLIECLKLFRRDNILNDKNFENACFSVFSCIPSGLPPKFRFIAKSYESFKHEFMPFS